MTKPDVSFLLRPIMGLAFEISMPLDRPPGVCPLCDNEMLVSEEVALVAAHGEIGLAHEQCVALYFGKSAVQES